MLREAGIEGPGSDRRGATSRRSARPTSRSGSIVDVAAVADAKFDALSAHSSQTDDSFFLKMGRERFRELFRNEWFVRAIDPFDRTGVDDDLFAGWR